MNTRLLEFYNLFFKLIEEAENSNLDNYYIEKLVQLLEEIREHVED